MHLEVFWMYLNLKGAVRSGLVKKMCPFSLRKTTLWESAYFRRKMGMLRVGRALVNGNRFGKCPRKGFGRRHI